MAKEHPECSFVHVDFDTKMNELAARKYEANGVRSVRVISDYAQHLDFPDACFDLVLCVNALYAISPQKQILRKVHSWLKPNGRFFVIDFGRKQRSLDWAIYLLRESVKSRRAGDYVRAVVEGREVWKQNRRSAKGQETGRYWLHSTTDFGNTLVDSGFEVDELQPCYRGYADLAICRKGRI
jgi:ubiquinone/menaquinone biosynthesis C-methylase UbiE